MELSLKARSQPIRTVSFVPPMISTGNPDISEIHSAVQKAIDKSEGKQPKKKKSTQPRRRRRLRPPAGQHHRWLDRQPQAGVRRQPGRRPLLRLLTCRTSGWCRACRDHGLAATAPVGFRRASDDLWTDPRGRGRGHLEPARAARGGAGRAAGAEPRARARSWWSTTPPPTAPTSCWRAETDLDVVRLAQNTGGAGGFAVGIERALTHEPDLVWLLDDDTIPTPDAARGAGPRLEGVRRPAAAGLPPCSPARSCGPTAATTR